MRYPRWILASVLSAIVCCGLAHSQAVNATLLGAVTDSTGAIIPGAKVVVTEVNTNISHTGKTNESGNYTFPDLPPGDYSVRVEIAGFKAETRTNVALLVNTSTRVDVQLQPGNVSESVIVSAAPALLETDRADTGRKLEEVLVVDVPLGTNRNFQSLLNLVPGTAPASFQHSQFFNASSSLQTEVNGQLREGNNYLIEGTDDNERTGLLQILVPPIEAIQTVDVSTSNFDPELGRATGAVVNVVLKSGSNAYHGAAYEFLQNSDFNSRSFFNPSVGHLAYNYVGGNFGGAFKKNKLFFFGDYLRVMDHEGNTNLTTIPSAAFRTGDLSAGATQVYDPLSGNPDGTGRTPFANNQIPMNRINKVSAAILALLPATNQSFNPAKPSNNYYALLPFQKTTDSLDYKMDYNISDNDRLSGRFSFARPVVFQAPIFGSAGGPAQSAFEGTGTQKTYSAGLNFDHTFSPSLLLESRLGIAHYHNAATQSDYGSMDAATVGVPGVNISPFTSGMVGITIPNFAGASLTTLTPLVGYSASLPWIRAEANVDFVNTVTKIFGNHTFKVGGDIRRLRDELLQDQTFSPRGIYQFGENQTSIPGAKTGIANDMASFLLDVPLQVGRDVNTYFPAYRAWQFFVFAGDKWVVTPKLTVDLGLRWELYPPATPAFSGGFSNYNPSNNTLVVAGVGGNPSNLGLVNHLNYWSPRIGIAYRLTEKTVIRAGFGISYTPFPDNTYAYNFPVRANNAYNPIGNGYGPALLTNGQPATFQAGFPAPIPVSIPSNGIIPATGSLLNSNYAVINHDFKNPHVNSWNFAVQQALPYHFTLDLTYIGSHGVDTVAQVNLNAGQIIGAGTAGEPEYAAFGRTASSTLFFQGFSSSYEALQAKFDRRFTNGFLLTTAFTWGKALNYQQDDDTGPLFYVDPRRNYARADYDREFNFVQSYVYELPFGKGRKWLTGGPASYVLGGWGLSGILTVASGTPFTVTANGGSLNLPGSTQTANQVGPVSILHGINTGNQWFSTASFTQPVGAVYGTSGRNNISGPGLFGLNLSLFKDFHITERLNLQLRCETFNLTNTPQFANPTSSLTSPTFGFVTSTLGSGTGVNGVGGGRAVQLAVRVLF
ncbi:MAG TPA: TonB-dependent receptor [Bryobacteraceae bacterium]|nr:TonB-dependent receptor [Bryobacteraceae bacterium]